MNAEVKQEHDMPGGPVVTGGDVPVAHADEGGSKVALGRVATESAGEGEEARQIKTTATASPLTRSMSRSSSVRFRIELEEEPLPDWDVTVAAEEGKLRREGKSARLPGVKSSVTVTWLSTLLALVLVWFLLGTLFYDLYSSSTATPLNTAQAFFYAVDAGLSIGFTVFTYDDDVTMVFSSINLFIGASFATATLSLFIEHVLDKQDAKRASLKTSFSKADIDGDGCLDVGRVRHARSPSRSSRPSWRLWPRTPGRVSGCFISSTPLNLLVVFVLWWLVGTIYGMAYEGWSFMISQYFAIAVMATAGFVYPSTGTFPMVFTGLYCMFGIPIFFTCCAKMAAGILSFHARRKMEVEVYKRRRATDAELEEILGGRGVGLEALDLYDFMCVNLARLGLLDRELLVEVEAEFERLDTDNSLAVSMTEISVGRSATRADSQSRAVVS